MRYETRDGSRLAADPSYTLWVNKTAQILSFAEVEGFDRMKFTNYDQMMDRARQISRSGYRIQ